MTEYEIRRASREDINFLAEAVIAAEKGISDKCNYSTLFNISEEEAKNKIISMFQEEVEGCEFSLANYLITEYQGKPVATFGAWIECFNGCMPSSVLKSNLIRIKYDLNSIEFLASKADILKDLVVERSPMTLQFEYLYVSEGHRGKNLAHDLIYKQEIIAKTKYPDLRKAQFQLFGNNSIIINLFGKHGYKVARILRSDNDEILNYLPSNEKLVMEKEFN